VATKKITADGANPFAQAFGYLTDAAEQITSLFSGIKLPAAPDMETLLSAHQRNMEALSAVNRIALEGAQAVARRHTEIVHQTMSELSANILSLATLTKTPQAKAAKQTELLKKAYEGTVSNTRELSDLIQHSNTEAMEVLSHRFTEALDEVKFLAGKDDSGAS
jgi:phasin family protein